MDTTTNLTIVGARQYDPGTGRFATADPVLESTDPGQLSRYGYGAGNPNTNADPTRRMVPCDTCYDPGPAPAKSQPSTSTNPASGSSTADGTATDFDHEARLPGQDLAMNGRTSI
jgi:RHS repeat-associated protein